MTRAFFIFSSSAYWRVLWIDLVQNNEEQHNHTPNARRSRRSRRSRRLTYYYSLIVARRSLTLYQGRPVEVGGPPRQQFGNSKEVIGTGASFVEANRTARKHRPGSELGWTPGA